VIRYLSISKYPQYPKVTSRVASEIFIAEFVHSCPAHLTPSFHQILPRRVVVTTRVTVAVRAPTTLPITCLVTVVVCTLVTLRVEDTVVAR
jgi:hypothetical protein